MRLDFLWRFGALAVLPLAPLAVAWVRTRGQKLHFLAGGRHLAFISGLSVITLALMTYLGFCVSASQMPEGWLGTPWIRVGFWTTVGGLALLLVGRGTGRLWAALSGILLLGLWLSLAFMTP
jgi:hypothetical protein